MAVHRPKKKMTMGDYEAIHRTQFGKPASTSLDDSDDEFIEAEHQARARRRRWAPFAAQEWYGPAVTQEAMTESEMVWGRYVLASSAFDVLSSGAVTVVALVYSFRGTSVSLACLAIQSASHLVSSVLLALRLRDEQGLAERFPASDSGPDSEEECSSALKKHRRIALGREQGFHVAMGVLMLVSSVGLAYQGYDKVERWTRHKDHSVEDHEVQLVSEILAWYGSVIYLLQAIFRGVASYYLRSGVIWQTCSTSCVVFLFLVGLGISASFQKAATWHAEPIVAIVLAMATLIEGIRLVVYHAEDIDQQLDINPRA